MQIIVSYEDIALLAGRPQSDTLTVTYLGKTREYQKLSELVLALNRKLVLAEHKIWDPWTIENAPKNRAILGWCPSYHQGKGAWRVVEWYEKEQKWLDADTFPCTPTMWLELPPNPRYLEEGPQRES